MTSHHLEVCQHKDILFCSNPLTLKTDQHSTSPFSDTAQSNIEHARKENDPQGIKV